MILWVSVEGRLGNAFHGASSATLYVCRQTKAGNLQLLVSVRNLQQQHSSSKYSVKSYESNSGKVYDGVVDR